MSSVTQFINRCLYAYSFLELPHYEERTRTGSLFGYTYQLDGIAYEVQIEQSAIIDGELHVNVHHIESGILEMNVPSSLFFSELDKSVQRKLDREEVIHHA